MPKRILIAEDQLATREVVTRLATMRGYEVVAVSNGIELLSIAEDQKFDLIITDLVMPDLNGASATEFIKMQGNATPVIALTGLSHHDVRLVQTKFTKIFHKPINVDKMFEYIKSLLEK
jgi:osomolarity two-component system response regulator SKN7